MLKELSLQEVLGFKRTYFVHYPVTALVPKYVLLRCQESGIRYIKSFLLSSNKICKYSEVIAFASYYLDSIL